MKVDYTAGAWPTPAGYLYGYVSTQVAGHRQIDVASTVYTVTSGYYRGDALVAQVNADVAGTWAVSNGEITTTHGTATVTATDSLMRLLGFGTEVGDAFAGVTTKRSIYVSPVIIPHLGAQWQAVDVARDVDLASDATIRDLSSVWGGARVWRWTITLDRYAYAAFRVGWCSRGKVAVTGTDASDLSGGNADGVLAGHVVAVEGVEWAGPADLGLCRVKLIVAGGTA